MAKREPRRGYSQLNGMVDLVDGVLAALTNVPQSSRDSADGSGAMPTGASRKIAIIGPPGGGKSVLAKAITRLALHSYSVMDNPDFRIRFDQLPVMNSGIEATTLSEYQDWLFKLVCEEGLQVAKTAIFGATKYGAHGHPADHTSDIENFRLPPITLKVKNTQTNISIPFRLSMLDLPGELMAGDLKFDKDEITEEVIERASTGDNVSDVTLMNGLVKLAMADLLLIVIPMRFSESNNFYFTVYIARTLNLIIDVLKKKWQSDKNMKLPDIHFCFSKYEATFLDGQMNSAQRDKAMTRECAHNALAMFLGSPQANGLGQILIDAYSDMRKISDEFGLQMPNIALSCMSSFGFQPGGVPNVRTLNAGDSAMDVLGTSQVGADPQDGLYVTADAFRLEEHWVPFGVEEPILEAASQYLFPAGAGEVPSRRGRRSFGFEEFFLRGDAR